MAEEIERWCGMTAREPGPHTPSYRSQVVPVEDSLSLSLVLCFPHSAISTKARRPKPSSIALKNPLRPRPSMGCRVPFHRLFGCPFN